LLPYGYFEGAKFGREDDTDIIHLQFKANQFTVKGHSLNEMFTAFQTLSVDWIKECPRRYQALSKAQGFIEKIEAKAGKE